MEHTKEKLLEETRPIQRHAQIVSIVNDAESAQEADDKVSELEFPSPMARQARLLWTLSREHPEEFDAIVQESASAEPETDSGQRVFPVSYRKHSSADSYGSMVVKPHFALPPIFWEYTLLDEEGQIVYSTQDILERYWAGRLHDTIECDLAHGSYSLPASLRIRFEKELNGISVALIVTKKSAGSYPSHTDTFTWTRHITVVNQSEQGNDWYERTISHSAYGRSNDRVLFRKFSAEENETFFHGGLLGENMEYWVLVLETDVNSPLDDQFTRYMPFTITTIYDVLCPIDWQERVADIRLVFGKLERTKLPYRNPGSAQVELAPFIGHGSICESRGTSVRTRYGTVEEAIKEISQHTPKEVDGLASLRYFFGLKGRLDTGIYNSSTTEELGKELLIFQNDGPLPLWRPQKKT